MRTIALYLTFAQLISVSCPLDLRAETEQVVIGVLAPLTGVRADAGAFQRNAAVLALENRDGRATRALRLAFEDTRYSPKDAVTGYHKLRYEHAVSFIVGPYGSSEVMAVGPLSEREGVVLLLPGAQSEEISDLGSQIFRMIHNSAQEAPFFGHYVADHMSGDSLPVLAGLTAFTAPYLKRFEITLKERGKSLVIVSEFDVHETDFRAALTKLKSLKPSDVMLVATPENAANILTQAQKLGLTSAWYNIGVEGPELQALSQSAAKGLTYPYSFDCRSGTLETTRFCGSYRDRFGGDPDAIAANTYDSITLLGNCIDRVGTSPERVSKCLYTTRGYEGVGGTLSIDKRGDAVRKLMIKKLGN